MAKSGRDNRMVVISASESANFIRQFNDNKVTPDFLASCKKAGQLFAHDNDNDKHENRE